MSLNGEDQSYQFDESAEDVDLSGISSKDVGDVDPLGDESMQDDPELEVIKARVKEMEEEAEKIKEMQNEVEKQYGNMGPSRKGSPPALSVEEKLDADTRSVWIGNVDYGATAEELEAHFHGCGSVNRVTIMCDKYTGHPKGFAYVEFADKDAVNTAMALDESLFRGRQIKVTCKRTNRPGISTTNRPPRARYMRPRYGYAPIYATHVPRFRGRFRPRKSFHYSPY